MYTKVPLNRLNSLYVCKHTHIHIHVHIYETISIEEAVNLKGSRKGDLGGVGGEREG